MILRSVVGLVVAMVLGAVTGCAQGMVEMPDVARRDVVRGEVAPLCGAQSQACCGGTACNPPLGCELGACCGNGGATCASPTDCCTAFGCNDGFCCATPGERSC